MEIVLYQMKCKKNMVDKKGFIFPIVDNNNNPLDLDIHFKYGSDIMNVSIILKMYDEYHGNLLRKTNYVYIKKFGRYYFVDNIEFLQGGQFKLDCSVDVLYTYANQILSTPQIIRRNEFAYNGLYPDEKYPIPQKKNPQVINIGGSPFIKTNMASSKRCIAFTVSGGVV